MTPSSNLLNVWGTAVINPLQEMWGRFVTFLPNLCGAIIILLVGWLVASGLDKLVTNILKQLKIDSALNRVGTKSFLEKAGIELEMSDVIGNLVRWTVLLIAFLAAADVLGLSSVTDFLYAVLAYIPQVFVAIGILVLGLLAAHFFAGIIRGTFGAAKLSTAKLLATVVKWVVYIFTIGAALQQLGIATTLINNFMIAIFFMIALAGGLAFGLGGQKTASEWLEDVKKEVGHKR